MWNSRWPNWPFEQSSRTTPGPAGSPTPTADCNELGRDMFNFKLTSLNYISGLISGRDSAHSAGCSRGYLPGPAVRRGR